MRIAGPVVEAAVVGEFRPPCHPGQLHRPPLTLERTGSGEIADVDQRRRARVGGRLRRPLLSVCVRD